jgi:hypothetical protein
VTILLGRFAFTVGCAHHDADDLAPGPDGEPACGPCRAEWGQLDDDAEYTAYAYH